MRNDPVCLDIDMRSPEFAKNPYKTYQVFLEKYPVFTLPDGTYVLSRFDDVKETLKNYKLYGSGWAEAPIAHPQWLRDEHKRGHFLPETNPPEHTHNSGLVSKLFISRAIDELRPFMRATAEGLLAKHKRKDGFDFLADFAFPYTASILRKFSGLEVCSDISLIRSWVDLSESFTPDEPESVTRAHIEAVIAEQNAYYDEVVRKQRSFPERNLAGLLANGSQLTGEPFTQRQLRGALHLFIIGGFDTPAQTLANGLLVLSDRPDILRDLRNSPDLIPAFVEEILRFNSPAQGLMRTTLQSIDLHGFTIPEGKNILALVGAANHDPRKFSDPDVFVVGRDGNKHLGFGHGVHACIGATLSRVEICIAFEVLLENFSVIECPANQDLKWFSSMVGRLLHSLPASLS